MGRTWDRAWVVKAAGKNSGVEEVSREEFRKKTGKKKGLLGGSFFRSL